MIRVRRAAERFVSESEGIRSLHWYSSGSHYDAQRMGFGSLVGYDEHIVGPGHGFAPHRHRWVDIYTLVLEGTLAHRDDQGNEHLVHPGMLQIQRSGTGIEHSEMNASNDSPLRFLQILYQEATETALEPQYTVGSYDEMVEAELSPLQKLSLVDDATYELGDTAVHVQLLSGLVTATAMMPETEFGEGAQLMVNDCLEISGEKVLLRADEPCELLVTPVR